jgi:hypothetical protein
MRFSFTAALLVFIMRACLSVIMRSYNKINFKEYILLSELMQLFENNLAVTNIVLGLYNPEDTECENHLLSPSFRGKHCTQQYAVSTTDNFKYC